MRRLFLRLACIAVRVRFARRQWQRHDGQLVDDRFEHRTARLRQIVHPQSLRHVFPWKPARRGDRLEQRAEHRRHETRQGQAGEHRRIDGQRHLDQRGHELLFADEHGVVDAIVALLGRVAMLQRLACGGIRIRIRATFRICWFSRRPRIVLESTFRRVRVLVTHVQFATLVRHFALHDVQIDADATYRLA